MQEQNLQNVVNTEDVKLQKTFICKESVFIKR